MVSRLARRPNGIAKNVKDEKVYTRQELEAEVKNAVDKKVAELTNKQDESTSIVAPKEKSKPGTNRFQLAASQQPKNLRPQKLTHQERDQLAADLRLTPSVDEEELLAFPEQEHPN